MKKMYSVLPFKRLAMLFMGTFMLLLSHQAKAQCPNIAFSDTIAEICYYSNGFRLSNYFELTAPELIVANGYLWNTSGSGNFLPSTPDPFDSQLIYMPSANDIADGSVTLTVVIRPLPELTSCDTITKTFTLTILPDPQVDFTWSGSSCSGIEGVTFTAISNTGVTFAPDDVFYWEFSDGTTRTGETVTKQFYVSGEYSAKLTAIISGCQMPPVSKYISIKTKPNALFTSEKHCHEVTFFDQSSAPGSQIMLREWDFGDGETHSGIMTAPHTYAQAGEYDVTLTVMTTDSCQAFFSERITIIDPPFPDFRATDTCVGAPTQFEYLYAGSPVVSYLWNFGDHASGIYNSSTEENPQHTYMAEGTYEVRLIVTNAEGCIGEQMRNVWIQSVEPIHIISNEDNSYCVGQTATFETDHPTWNHEWYVDGSKKSAQPIFVYDFLDAGNYTISVKAKDGDGCTSTADTTIHIGAMPTAVFAVSTPVCLGTPIQFTDNSTGSTNIVLWHWYFGDGSDTLVDSPGNQNVSHTYSNAGLFTTSLVIKTVSGCTDSITRQVEVLEGAQAMFASPTPSCAGALVEFINQTQPNDGTLEYLWTFEGGTPATSTERNPVITFMEAGTYGISLTVTSTQTGCYSTYPEADSPITIEITEGITASITANTNTVCQGEPIVFTATPEGATFEWNFDDGTIVTNTNTEFSYTYTTSGNYTVSLQATLGDCVSAPVSQLVTVKAIPSSAFEDSISSCPNDPVWFTYTIGAGYSDLESLTWVFGDGSDPQVTFPPATNVSHVYPGLGPYDVTLTAEAAGCSSTTTKSITLNPPAFTAGYSVSKTEICAGNSLTFENQTSEITETMEWLWTVTNPAGNPETFTEENLTEYTFEEVGEYFVSLTVTDTETGCSDTYPKDAVIGKITVSAPPEVTFEMDSDTICQGTTIHFTAQSNPAGASFTWAFGDGSTSPGAVVSHTYATHGTYTVVLVATSASGDCIAEAEPQQVTVHSIPVSNFVHNAPMCQGSEVTFTSTTQHLDPIEEFKWDFDDGSGVTSVTTTATSHTYASSGEFFVTLEAKTIYGCSSVSPVDTVQIYAKPTTGLPFITGACVKSEVTFIANQSSSNDPNNPIEEYQWVFSDGMTRKGYEITRTFTEAGDYDVTLTVRNANTLCEYTLENHPFTILDAIDYDVYVDEELHSNTLPPTHTYNACCDAGVKFKFQPSADMPPPQPLITWDFGDGTIVPNLNELSHVYEEAGVYTVTLTVHSTFDGCQGMTTFVVNAVEPPVADFTPETNLSCIAQEVLFVDNSTLGSEGMSNYIEKMTWNFNDGTGDIEGDLLNRDILHIFERPGDYNVMLEVEDHFGCKATTEKPITIIPNATAKFRYDSACLSEAFLFYDESTPNNSAHIVEWAWDFGDVGNSTSMLQNPAHQFSAPTEGDEKYEVKLVITNEIGCKDTTTQYVTVSPCFEALFDVQTAGVGSSTCAGTEVLFTNKSEIPTSATFISYVWDFDDGTTQTITTQNQSAMPYTYTEGGNYNVKLTLNIQISGRNYSDSITKRVVIVPVPTAILANVYEGCIDNEIEIMDQSVSNSEGEINPITTWEWTFGTNSPITQYQPGITFMLDNTEIQSVQLKVSNAFGCSDTTTAQITYKESPLIDFTVSDSCAQAEFQFEVVVENELPIASYQWNFGDGTPNEQLLEPYASHIFETEGTYEVILIAESNGCFTEKTKQISVYPIPFVDFIYTENVDGQQGNFQFENLSQDGIMFNWIFNTTDTLIETNPLYLFGTDSPNIVELIAWNQYGCYASKIDSIMGLTYYGLYFPNAFLPDSENPEVNRFTGKGVNLLEYRLEVFSKWGQLLWSSEELENGSPSESWDGTYEGEKLPMGSYVWRATAKFTDGNIWKGSDNSDGNTKKFGIINLIR